MGVTASNTILTPTAVTREALRILHQKLTFIGTINRQYDDSFAKSGAKIGDSLKIRLPNQYTVRTGRTLSPNDTSETSTTLTVATQKGVDISFYSDQLTMSLDDFSSRILEPAMAVLAASLEADAMSMYKDVYQMYDADATAPAFNQFLYGRKILNDALAPMDDNRTALLSTTTQVKIVDALKGLFHDSNAIKKQYRDGIMGRTAGFDFYESTHVNDHTTGTALKATTYTVNGASQTGSTVVVATGATTFKQGDIVTFAGCNRVHPESKVSTGQLQQFVITADYAGGAGSLAISPAITVTGARQNVSASPTNGGAVTKVGAGASELLKTDMVYHKDAFTLATADLLMPKGVDWSARETYDGISMRIVRAYDINSDAFPCRLDILYGYKTIRPELAARIHADG